jgi:hypothetical protein
MANHVIPNPGPHIATPATNRLLAHLDVLARRQPELVVTVIAIRHGDDEPLLELVRAAQAGSRDSATVAVGALLPKLCKVVLSKETVFNWESSIDDYLTLAYFSIVDVSADETALHLANKIVARTRLRHEWEREVARRPRPVPDSILLAVAPAVANVEEIVLGRLALDELALTIDRIGLTPAQWRAVTRSAFGEATGRPQLARQRQAASRARRRLASWFESTEAA